MRNLQALGFPGAFETTTDMAAQLIDLVRLRPAGIVLQRVRAEDSGGHRRRRAARRASAHPAATRASSSWSADLSKIEKPIRDANLGPVTVVTVDDVLR